jgi:hypothetical protein
MRRPVPLLSARAALLSVAVTALATLLASCGGAAPAPPAPPPPPPPMPRYTTMAELGGATGGQMKLDKTAKISVTGGAVGGQVADSTTAEGLIRYDPAGSSMQLTQRVQTASAPAPIEMVMIVLPDQAYVKPPPDAGMPPGKPWLRIQPNSPDPVSQQFAGLVQSVRENADPTQSFVQFGDAATIVESTEEPLDAVRTVRYRVRVDVARAAAREPNPAARMALQETVQAGISTVESTIWLDERNRPLRVLVQQPLPAGQGSYTLDARYRDWGLPVEINPPPADQVATS